jgi:hypothetical protein
MALCRWRMIGVCVYTGHYISVVYTRRGALQVCFVTRQFPDW